MRTKALSHLGGAAIVHQVPCTHGFQSSQDLICSFRFAYGNHVSDCAGLNRSNVPWSALSPITLLALTMSVDNGNSSCLPDAKSLTESEIRRSIAAIIPSSETTCLHEVIRPSPPFSCQMLSLQKVWVWKRFRRNSWQSVCVVSNLAGTALCPLVKIMDKIRYVRSQLHGLVQPPSVPRFLGLAPGG